MKDKIAVDSPLGKDTQYPDEYAPQLLYAIPRASSRTLLGIDSPLPFTGVDIWNAYELSWLNTRGKPEVACAEFRIACESPFIIESKSFKLYLNSLNNSRFANREEVASILAADLSACAGDTVEVIIDQLNSMEDGEFSGHHYEQDFHNIDDQDVDIDQYEVNPQLLSVKPNAKPVSEKLSTDLLRSLCPVTGQPDWASLLIEYDGPQICQAGLLRYLISYRQHQEFHEQCVERIFIDLMQHCQPNSLSVYARYVRRGGLDINPYRSNNPPFTPVVANYRLKRQ